MICKTSESSMKRMCEMCERNGHKLKNNFGLKAGQIITEIRYHPFISQEEGKHWDHQPEVLKFQILEVEKEYKCLYLGADENEWFYWHFTDRLRDFMPGGGIPVHYYVDEEGEKANADSVGQDIRQ